jgi:hypothetical protein
MNVFTFSRDLPPGPSAASPIAALGATPEFATGPMLAVNSSPGAVRSPVNQRGQHPASEGSAAGVHCAGGDRNTISFMVWFSR